jgi:repressor LexA
MMLLTERMPDECTDREREILRAIVNASAAKGYPPSVRELCETLRVASTNGMVEHLRKLVRKGLLEREIATARALRVTPLGLTEMLLEQPKVSE